MHRLGLRRVLVDPMVTTTYRQRVKAAIHARARLERYGEVAKLQITTWGDLQRSPDARLDWGDPQWAVDYKNVECCDLTPDRDQVDWSKCRRVDVMGGSSKAGTDTAAGAAAAEAAAGGAAGGGAGVGGSGNHTADFINLCNLPCARREALAEAAAELSKRGAAPAAAGGNSTAAPAAAGGRAGEQLLLLQYCPAC